MSFYLDDDDPYFSSSSKFFKEEEGFICENCGGNDSYVDASTGAQCCSSCFTQSQSVLPASQDVGESAMEFEDIMGLAARTRGGRLVHQRASTMRSSGGRSARGLRKPMEDLDHSVSLPDLITCLWAIQRVLQKAAVCAVNLVVVGENRNSFKSPVSSLLLPTSESIHETVISTVQTIWNNYLIMWKEGSEYYGRRHPEIRFSFRDLFLQGNCKSIVIRHLSHQAALRTRKELEEREDLQEDDDENELQSLSSSSSYESSNKPVDTKAANKPSAPSSGYSWGAIRRLLVKSYPNAKGRKEVALSLQPSMSLCAAIIWLAVRHLGITSCHVVNWIANGSLPLLNAFDSLLYPSPSHPQLLSSSTCKAHPDDNDNDDDDDDAEASQRKPSLRMIARFFRMRAPPRHSSLEHLAKSIAFCSGIEASEGSTAPVKGTADGKRNQSKRWAFRSITSQSLPMITARMVSDLGLSQQVFDMALALMGLYPKSNTEKTLAAVADWSPPTTTSLPTNEQEAIKLPMPAPPTRSLDLASRLSTLTQVAGVIVAACKLCPGWESWTYCLRNGPLPNRRGSQHQENDKREANRFVPWNDQELRFIKNTSLMENYLDFLEENLKKKDDDLLPPQFFDTFPQVSTENEDAGADLGRPDDVFSLPSNEHDRSNAKLDDVSMVAGARNPNQPNIRKRHKHHEWYLSVKDRAAVWADVNGLGNYVVYRSIAKERIHPRRRGRKPPLPCFPLESLHPHYVLLLEYVAYVTRLRVGPIHAFVTEIDSQIYRTSTSRKRPKRDGL